MKVPFINLKLQHENLKKEIERAVKKVFLHSNFRLGEEVSKFEEAFADYCGTKYCLSVGSGYDAILITLETLGVGQGDEVITVPNTFISTVTPIIRLDAKPIFVDVNPETYQMDVDRLEKAITKKTKVILPVHLYGIPSPMDKILSIAKKHSLYVVEDACQAHGSSFKGKKCGSLGDIAAFSFYPAKNLGASGEGGAIVTSSYRFAEKIKLLRHMGEKVRYKHEIVGYNSHLDTIDAAVLLIKLEFLDKWNLKRRKIAKTYNKNLAHLPIILPPNLGKHIVENFYVYVIRTPKRDKLFGFLRKRDIACAIHYPIPLHLQKALKFLGYKKGDFPHTERVSKEVLSLPIYPDLTRNQQEYVIESIRKFFKK